MGGSDEGTDVDRSDAGGHDDSDANAGDDHPRCPACNAVLFGRHCKYVCPQHGVIVDCSDPFL